MDQSHHTAPNLTPKNNHGSIRPALNVGLLDVGHPIPVESRVIDRAAARNVWAISQQDLKKRRGFGIICCCVRVLAGMQCMRVTGDEVKLLTMTGVASSSALLYPQNRVRGRFVSEGVLFQSFAWGIFLDL